MPKIATPITTEWRCFADLSATALYEILRLRQAIFVVEQHSPYPDLDGCDQRARHLLLRAAGVLGGCLRLLPPTTASPAVRIGRVAVCAGLRRQGLGRRLMTEALAFCEVRYPARPVMLGAQHHLAGFYESLGFGVTSAPYDDFGVSHVAMTRPGADDPAT